MRGRHLSALAWLAAIGLIAPAQAVWAEKEEIVITATKRSRVLQDVPIAVSAFQGADLEARGITELEDLQQIAPSLSAYNANSDSNGATLRIRGIGTTGNNPGLESAVGFFIDGVYRSRSGLGFSDFVDVERIEVLRGPQGTLFGKNTSAGAVSIVTKEPEFAFGSEIKLGVGNLNAKRGSFSLTGPVMGAGEQLAYRISGNFARREGFQDDIDSSDKFNDVDRWGFKGQLLWLPTDDLSVKLMADYAEKDESCCQAAYTEVGSFAREALNAVGAVIPDPSDPNPEDSLDVGTNFDPFEKVDDLGFLIEANWQLGAATLTSITSWRDFDVDRVNDNDFSNADILGFGDIDETFETFSQELRLAGTAGSVDWLVGAYVSTEDLVSDTLQNGFGADADVYFNEFLGRVAGASGPLFPGGLNFQPGQGFAENLKQDTRGWALFTHNTWSITDRLALTGGLRYTLETKDAKGIINGAAPGTVNDQTAGNLAGGVDFCNEFNETGQVTFGSLPGALAAFSNLFCRNASFKEDRTERELTGIVNLSYALNDDVNTYVSYSRGYKAGGFNLDQQSVRDLDADPDTPPQDNGLEFEPEFVDAYELGVKSRLLDGRLTLNTALFYQQVEGFQLNTFIGTGFIVSNLKEVTSRGIEVEAQMNVADGVFVSLGGTYNIARYSNGETGPDAGIAGKRLTHSPRFQAAGGIQIERPLPGTEWMGFVDTNVTYRSETNTGSDLLPQKVQRAFWLLNGRIGIRPPDRRWELALYGENITDKRYRELVFNTPFQGVPGNRSFSTFLGAPRFFGLEVRYRFD